MLSQEDSEILTHVGPGTMMGNLLRRYWTPALLTSEIPEPDSPPVRVRLLGEDLVAFRDSNGDVGLFAQACPHRGASITVCGEPAHGPGATRQRLRHRDAWRRVPLSR